MKIMTLFLLIAFIKSYQAFQLDLYQQQNRIQSTLQISSKKAHVQIDIETSQVIICCKPTRSIFQKIYYFLSNPFLHSFQYSCLEPQKTFQVDSLKLPILGPIDLPYRSIQSRYCYSGSLGLNKKSDFMTLLRQGQNQFFTIYIKTFENQKRDDKLFFGQKLPNEQIQSTIVLPSNDQQQWSVQALNVTINSQGFGKSKIILTTKNKVVKIPKGAFRQILMALKKKQCIVKQQQIFCPCETGKAQNYPKISFYFENNSIDINPQEYMQIHSEVCKVLIEAQNSLNVWKDLVLITCKIKFQQARWRLRMNRQDKQSCQFNQCQTVQ